MQPPPADFSQPHTMVHASEDLISWVRNGKQGTAMPGFGDTLSDQEIRDVLSYIDAEQGAMGALSTTPVMLVAASGAGSLFADRIDP